MISAMKRRKLLADTWRVVGAIGAVAYIVIFALRPSFPTPDKIFVFLLLVFMAFGQGWEVIKRFAPFVGLLLVYESFRGLVPSLNNHVNYTWLPHMDRLIFGTLPTVTLQRWLWQGHVVWYDFVLYGAYTLHFVLPFTLAVLIWKFREPHYWRFVATYLVVSFAGFLTFLVFPASPPWMASDKGYIEPIRRISSDVWAAFGIKDFPSVYNTISPNPVAAMPSLHAAYATLLIIFVYKLFGKKWAALAALYPFCIYLGTVYTGEHFAIDEIAGIIYAIGAYLLTGYIFRTVLPKIKGRNGKHSPKGRHLITTKA
jgi:hypothetical protein